MQSLIDAKEAAKKLNVKTTRVYELVREEKIPRGVVVKLGERQLRFNPSALDAWLEGGGTQEGGVRDAA